MPLTLRARSAAAMLALVATSPLAAQSAQKFAYVNTGEILQAAPGRTEAEAQLQKEATSMKATLEKMNASYLEMVSAYSKLPATTTSAERDKRTKTVQEKQGELQQKNQEFQERYSQRQAELLQPILDQIKLVLEDLRVEGGYTMIFDVGQSGSIVAADKNLDISGRAIAKLRTLPKPTVVSKSDTDKVEAPKKPSAGPVSTPAGVTRPGSSPAAPPKKPDSTATKSPAGE